MAGPKELRETMLSCALKHPAVDLRGTSEHTKCRGGGHVAPHRTLTHTHTEHTTVESHRCADTCSQVKLMTAKLRAKRE